MAYNAIIVNQSITINKKKKNWQLIHEHAILCTIPIMYILFRRGIIVYMSKLHMFVCKIDFFLKYEWHNFRIQNETNSI